MTHRDSLGRKFMERNTGEEFNRETFVEAKGPSLFSSRRQMRRHSHSQIFDFQADLAAEGQTFVGRKRMPQISKGVCFSASTDQEHQHAYSLLTLHTGSNMTDIHRPGKYHVGR